ncbi:hypothetical protein [Pseudomonas sp. B28(2017)]|uniref:hypothetical protein n=1 Tax=Pseudomonas sp. B28(2017) TaxID=1981730 RepID=UPI00117B13B2|nr:hypothetical protein [Pseudomonas sp. B28(2017)]
MKPKTVGFNLFVLLALYSFSLFLVVGVCAVFFGASVNYFKHDVWTFSGEDITKILKMASIYGFFAAVGIWIKSKINERKKNKEHR